MSPHDHKSATQEGGRIPARTGETKPRTDWFTRIVLTLVMGGALGVGTWSVFTLLTETLRVPTPIAVFGCFMFDGAAFFFARLAQRYATTSDSGLAPRLAMLAMICTSAWVNWQHAQLKHWGTVGGVILGAAPVIAELAFEMWHRYEHREALRALGRVAQTLPVLGKWAWITHPRRSRRVLDAHIHAALTETEAVAERRRELATARAHAIIAAPKMPAEAPPETLPERPKETPQSATAQPAVAPQSATLERHEAPAQSATKAPQPRPAKRPESAPVAAPKAPRKAPSKRPEERHEKGGRSAAKAVIEALYGELGRRPLESEMVAALIKAKSKFTSRQFANKIRSEIERDEPGLAALGSDNVRALTGS